MSIYDTLNEQQKEAVLHTEGPLLILAGAGSGKTRVLTHRIAYLIEEQGVNPWNILAITFTNKAAGEMRERVDKLVGFGAESIWVSTFHSTCVRILRRHIDLLGYDNNFTIYDSDDQKTLMKDVCKLLQIDTTNILFICGGAFDGLEKIIENRLGAGSIGFNAEIVDKQNQDIDELLKQVMPQDLTKFGLIPEFIGRVPVTVALRSLSEDALVKILSEPKNAIIKQYQAFFDLDGVKLEFTEEALTAIAHLAVERKTGARGLRSIMESIMMDIMYEIPSDSSIGICTVTKEAVEGKSEPELVYRENTVPRKSFTGRLKKDKTGEIA